MKRTLQLLRNNFKRNTDIQSRAVDEPVNLTFDIFLLVAFFITLTTSIVFTFRRGNGQNEFFLNILVESYGLVFDLLIVGCLLLWFTKLAERKLEIKRYKNEIDDFRLIRGNEEVSARIMGNVKRLSNMSYTKVDLHMCDLSYQHFTKNTNDTGSRHSLNLNGANFFAAKLTKSIFFGCYLENANFRSAKLQNAYFGLANLNNAKFNGADLKGAVFTDAYFLETVDFSKAINITETKGIPSEIINIFSTSE